MYLVDWHSILKPFEYGGWNIKNLEWFSLSLRMKSCWMTLNGEGATLLSINILNIGLWMTGFVYMIFQFKDHLTYGIDSSDHFHGSLYNRAGGLEMEKESDWEWTLWLV